MKNKCDRTSTYMANTSPNITATQPEPEPDGSTNPTERTANAEVKNVRPKQKTTMPTRYSSR